MTKSHDLGYYSDGRVSVVYCKCCSAEGDKLLEDCPQKVFSEQNNFKNTLDEKKQTAK